MRPDATGHPVAAARHETVSQPETTGQPGAASQPETPPQSEAPSQPDGDSDPTCKKTIIVFSGDFDRAMAAFIIANGAAAMGDDVTMFFTFWGLNILRRPKKVKTRKGPIEAMFGAMMPRGAGRLGLSKMNFGGLGAVMMRRVMRQKNVATLEELIATAREQDIKMVACSMSMDVMGIGKEELIDGLEIAGVASYLWEADHANVNLFI